MSMRTRLTTMVAGSVAVPAALGVAIATPAMAAGQPTPKAPHANSRGMSPNTTGVSPKLSAANEKTAFDYFVGKGLSKKQSAGVVGNLIVESGVSPTARQPGGPGRGIAQWSVGGRWDHDRSDNMLWFAKTHGSSATALRPQLDFVWYELTAKNYGLPELKKAGTISAAVKAFEKKFEGCRTCHEDTRIKDATSTYNRYAGGGSANPYTAAQVCGSGYAVIDKHALGKSGTVYLLYRGSSKTNCVVTLKSSKLGAKSSVAATLQVKGGGVARDSGNYTYYAGPVTKTAGRKCVKWGGAAESHSWTSGYGHCG